MREALYIEQPWRELWTNLESTVGEMARSGAFGDLRGLGIRRVSDAYWRESDHGYAGYARRTRRTPEGRRSRGKLSAYWMACEARHTHQSGTGRIVRPRWIKGRKADTRLGRRASLPQLG